MGAERDPLLEQLGLTYSLVLDLNDAGLVESSPMVVRTITAERAFILYGKFVLNLDNCNGLRYGVHPLTRPGRELARIAQVLREQKNFISMARWIASKKPDVKSRWAEMPTRGGRVLSPN